jgi:hypothetical protein
VTSQVPRNFDYAGEVSLASSTSGRHDDWVGTGTNSVRSVGGLGGLAVALACLLAACGPSTPTVSVYTYLTQISKQYSTLFNFANKNISSKTAAIQDGSSLKQALSQALSSQLAKEATGARVVSGQVLSSSTCSQEASPSPCAKVSYEILGVNGQPLFLTPSSGYAVYANGEWLVAKATICGLLELFYSESGVSRVPPGC